MEIDHDFDIENFNRSARCMKCARQLFPDAKQQEIWATYAFKQWQDHGTPPEVSRNKRNPHWAKSLEIWEKRKKTKLRFY